MAIVMIGGRERSFGRSEDSWILNYCGTQAGGGRLGRDDGGGVSRQQLLGDLAKDVLGRDGSGISVKVQMTSKRSPGHCWGMTVPGITGSDEASAGMRSCSQQISTTPEQVLTTLAASSGSWPSAKSDAIWTPRRPLRPWIV